MNSDTPRTDEEVDKISRPMGVASFVNYTRKLERELAATQAQLNAASKSEEALSYYKNLAKQYENSHKLFDWDLVKLLQRYQNGEATCIYTAQVIEAEMEELRKDKERLDHLQTQWSWCDGGDSGHGYWSNEIVGPDSTPRYYTPKPEDERPDIRYAIDVDRGVRNPNAS